MSTLLWIGVVLAGIVGLIVIIAAIVSRGKKRFMERAEKERPTDHDDYYLYQRTKLGEMKRRDCPVREIYQYAASEVGLISSSGDTETNTKMNWLNAWGLILNHMLKPDYTQEVWEKEGFDRLHIEVSEFAQQLSPKGLDIPFRPGFDADEIIARYESRHPNMKA